MPAQTDTFRALFQLLWSKLARLLSVSQNRFGACGGTSGFSVSKGSLLQESPPQTLALTGVLGLAAFLYGVYQLRQAGNFAAL